MDNLMLCIH